MGFGDLTYPLVAIAFLLVSGLWAEARFRRFNKLPAHFNMSGNPTRFASRSFVIWLTPVTFIAIIGFLVWTVDNVPPESMNGDPVQALTMVSLIIMGTQVFILWLISRWARAQG